MLCFSSELRDFLNYSPIELYFLLHFGHTSLLKLIFFSNRFQFAIYTVLSYPFAWVISIFKDLEKRKRGHITYLLCCCVLPVIYIIYAIYNRSPGIDEILGQIIMLALWLLRMWLILWVQVCIRRLARRFGLIGTIAATILCAWGLYKFLDCLIVSYPDPSTLFPLYQFI